MVHARAVVLTIAFAIWVLTACEDASERLRTDAPQAGIVEGDRAPEFELPSASGGTVRLSDYRGDKPVLLYFSMGPG
jgi:cytochrome oxidase Cu insertion factor (SCO1/SenC/PrrC family)